MDAAVAAVRPTDTLAVPLGPGQPASFLHALGDRTDWVDLRLTSALMVDLFAVCSQPGVHVISGFFGPAERFLRDAGADVQFVPADFRRFGRLYEHVPPRVMATVATPPDADGWLSLSLHAGASVEELHRCGADPDRVLIVEANPAFPHTFGILPEHGHRLHVDEIDVLVEGDRPPLVIAEEAPTEAETEIARIAGGYVTDGCTLQTGIGGVPNAVATLLAEGAGGDYGVHSEMFTSGLMRLHQACKVTNAHKGRYAGYSIATFAAGVAELYAFLDGNEDVRFLPVELVNAPEVIAANSRMVMVNAAVAVDLAGQVVADTAGGQQYSGIGGAEDFSMPSGLQNEDRSLLCLPSTAEVAGTTISRLVVGHPQGTIITTPRHQVDVIITEYGAAELRGLTVPERAQALAAIAHPSFRDELAEAAVTFGS